MNGSATLGCALLLVLATGCAQTAANPEGDDAPPPTEERPAAARGPDPDVESVLRRQPELGDYGVPERCLATSDYDNVEVLNSDYLIFRAHDGRYWINKIKKRCSGLHRGLILHLGTLNRQVCNGYMFEGVQTIAGRFETMTAACFLGVFQPASEDQVRALKALVNAR